MGWFPSMEGDGSGVSGFGRVWVSLVPVSEGSWGGHWALLPAGTVHFEYRRWDLVALSPPIPKQCGSHRACCQPTLLPPIEIGTSGRVPLGRVWVRGLQEQWGWGLWVLGQ